MRRIFLCCLLLVFSVSYNFSEETKPGIMGITKHGTFEVIHAEDSPGVPNVRFEILEPKNGEVVPGPDVTLKFNISNWKLYKEGESGQHLHIIVDNEPYQAHYSEEPFIAKNLSSGHHVIRAFASRPWHESVKQKSAFDMVEFYVREKTKDQVNEKAPMVVYSRPKGEYSLSKPPAGQPHEGILLDFFVRNVTLSSRTGYSVRATVDGTSLIIRMWKPHYVVGLKEGDHTFKIELLRKGQPVQGNFNSTERKITLRP